MLLSSIFIESTFSGFPLGGRFKNHGKELGKLETNYNLGKLNHHQNNICAEGRKSFTH